MTSKAIANIAFIGAGNVATHLAHAFKDAGYNILGVVSKGYDTAALLADAIGSPAYRTAGELPDDCDMVVISTNDDAVEAASQSLPRRDWIVVHTSGIVPITALSCRHSKAGVLYPLQTFSNDVPVNVNEVPFFIEASDPATEATIKQVASDISARVSVADSSVRCWLHVAGVLSSNFPIYLLHLCREVLAHEGLELDTVKPLVEATIAKAFDVGPEKAMTGPARRGDTSTISRHLALLEQLPDAQEVYALLSQKILKEYHPEL